MTPQTGPTSRPAITMDRLQEAVADLPDEKQICALISPVGVQVQLFYEDYSLATAFYGLGKELIEITHVLFQSDHITQHVLSSFIQNNIKFGNFDVSGVLYISFDSFLTINKYRAVNGLPTFRYVESALRHILNAYEYTEELRFTPNWSDAIACLSCIETYTEVLEVLTPDFKTIMDHLVCTTKTIENVQKLRYDALYIQKGMETSDFPKHSIILFNNDISKIKTLSNAEMNIIAEILIAEKPDKIKIEAIEVEPDRFGRIRPVISSDEITKYEYEFYTIELPTLESLAKANYQVGDVVEVSFINKIPRLGRIVEKSKKPNNNPLLKENCYCCGSKLLFKNGHLYCSNATCASTVFYKMLYAKSRRVLDLPFDWHNIHDLVMLRGVVTDLPSLFNLERSVLMCLFDTDVVDLVLKTLQTRIDQVNGDGYNASVQNIAQGRFLDALSIPGLHNENIKRLQIALAKGDWHWSELPSVLVDGGWLKHFKIPWIDAIEIVNAAKSRVTEFDNLVRGF